MVQGHGKAELRQARAAGRFLLLSAFVFSIFVNLLMLTGPLFMLQVYDRVLGSRSEETLVALAVLVMALYGLMGLLDYARGRVLARVGARFQATLDPRVFDAVLARTREAAPGTAQATGLRDMATIQQMFASPAMLALFDVPWTPIFLGVIFIFHPWLGWLATAGGAVLIAATLLNNWMTRRRMLAAQVAQARAQSFSDEIQRGHETVRGQGMAAAVARRWMTMREGALADTVAAADWQGFFGAFTKAFRLMLQSAILGLGAWLVLRGEMTAGAIIAGSVMMGRALAPIEQSIGQWALVQQSLAAWKALASLLETTPPAPEVMRLPRPEAHMRLAGVSVLNAPGGKPALLGITLDIRPGTVLGVIGRSGSGKTTLARTMLGLARPVQGEVRLGGATLDQYAPADLGAYIGYLPQDVMLFTGTVEENIARMGHEIDSAEVVRAAQRARAHELILNLPDGYRTRLDGRDIRLSGGQRQRIGLARALYGDPVMLILDEPNSALDHEGSEALNQAVRDFRASDRVVVLMTHRPIAIQECTRLAVIDQGRITAEGPRDEIVKTMLRNAGDVQRTVGGAGAAPEARGGPGPTGRTAQPGRPQPGAPAQPGPDQTDPVQPDPVQPVPAQPDPVHPGTGQSGSTAQPGPGPSGNTAQPGPAKPGPTAQPVRAQGTPAQPAAPDLADPTRIGSLQAQVGGSVGTGSRASSAPAAPGARPKPEDAGS